jgi:23S rRNA pseudouridine1911/1915/1917 synthase
MYDQSAFTILVKPHDSGKRLDIYISSCISDCSRSVATHLIREGKIRVQGMVRKPGYRVKAGDEICGCIPPPAPILFKPEPIPIEILHEDDDIIVINKQPGIVVHPAPGHHSGTLVNALLYHCPNLNGIGGALRPGIVHRLDKDTSGVLVAAKNDGAHLHLSRQFKSRRVKKMYLALVYGKMKSDSGSVSLPIGRHPVDRQIAEKVELPRPRGKSESVLNWQASSRLISKPAGRIKFGFTVLPSGIRLWVIKCMALVRPE